LNPSSWPEAVGHWLDNYTGTIYYILRYEGLSSQTLRHFVFLVRWRGGEKGILGLWDMSNPDSYSYYTPSDDDLRRAIRIVFGEEGK
jgi:hypothetical protein